MPTVEAKAKAQERRSRGIEAFLRWLDEHPNASKLQKVKKFDRMVDRGGDAPV